MMAALGCRFRPAASRASPRIHRESASRCHPAANTESSDRRFPMRQVHAAVVATRILYAPSRESVQDSHSVVLAGRPPVFGAGNRGSIVALLLVSRSGTASLMPLLSLASTKRQLFRHALDHSRIERGNNASIRRSRRAALGLSPKNRPPPLYKSRCLSARGALELARLVAAKSLS